MKLSSSTEAGLLVISVEETRIDAAVALAFKDQLRAQTATHSGMIVLDLSVVEFIDSSGLGALVAVLKMLGGGFAMALAGLNPSVSKVLRLTRMDTVFQLYATMDDALIALGSKSEGQGP